MADYRESPFGTLSGVQWGGFAGGVFSINLATDPFPSTPALSVGTPWPLIAGGTYYATYVDSQLTSPPAPSGAITVQSDIRIDARPTGGVFGDPIFAYPFPDGVETTMPAVTLVGAESAAEYTLPSFTATRGAGQFSIQIAGQLGRLVNPGLTGITSYSDPPNTDFITVPDAMYYLFDTATGNPIAVVLLLMSSTTGGAFVVGERLKFELDAA